MGSSDSPTLTHSHDPAMPQTPAASSNHETKETTGNIESCAE